MPKLLRGPLVYYLLAGFDVLTVSGSLYLHHRLMRIYVQSVAANQEWAQRMADYSALGQLAALVNAPGNDVFDSREVERESARMETALGDFQRQWDRLRADLRAAPGAEAEPLVAGLDAIDGAMREMVAEARMIFTHFDAENAQAGERMATMDRRYARLLAAQRELIVQVAAIQSRQFAGQMAAARALQRFEYVIAALILVMVAGATFYGRRTAQQAARDEAERVARIRELQEVDAALRREHALLESRVQERTAALRASESALRRAAEEWERTFEAIESAILILDREGRIVRLNRAACELSARSEADAAGRPVETLGPSEPWRLAAEVVRVTAAGACATGERALDATTGRTWEVSSNLVDDAEGAFGTGGAEHGSAERIIVVARDVTKLVELQESVWREERMSAIGALVAGVAHEVRNPLFAISSTLDAFEARHGEQESFGRYVRVLRREADRLTALMRDLLDYGRPPGLDVADVTLAAVVEDAVRICAPLAEQTSVRVERARGLELLRAPMDRARMVQVLRNLLENAIQHSPAGGVITVTGGRSGEREACWCAVRDSGPGFRPQDVPKLFEPFFTRRSGGTGLGLSIAQRIVAQHGGSIEASNHPDGGAVVTIRLPASAPSFA